MSSFATQDDLGNRLIDLHEYWYVHDKDKTQFNYSYLRHKDPLLIHAIDRKAFGIKGLAEAFEIAGINPLCHLKTILYGRNASLEERKKRYLKILYYMLSEIGDPKMLYVLNINSRKTFDPSLLQKNKDYPECKKCGCSVLPITFQSVYVRGRAIFGNWNAVLKAAGFDYRQIRRKKPKYPRKEVIQDLLLFMEKNNSLRGLYKKNMALHKGLWNSHSKSPFYFANMTVYKTALIEMQFLIKKKSHLKITPKEFYKEYIESEQTGNTI